MGCATAGVGSRVAREGATEQGAAVSAAANDGSVVGQGAVDQTGAGRAATGVGCAVSRQNAVDQCRVPGPAADVRNIVTEGAVGQAAIVSPTSVICRIGGKNAVIELAGISAATTGGGKSSRKRK